MKEQYDNVDQKFICALKTATKSSKHISEAVPGVRVDIYQGSQFRNLLHLSMFFRKATDGEARAWLARKQVIAWGIINELSLEIERLNAELAKSDADHQNLTVTL